MYRAPVEVMAAATSEPTKVRTFDTPLMIKIGLLRSKTVPSPSCPLAFLPHEYKAPDLLIAKQYEVASATAIGVVKPTICIGDVNVEVKPSCPEELPPHKYKFPSEVIADENN
jgi:hypothetical protein